MNDRWFKFERLRWIGEMLLVYGFINREHLMKKFYVSKPTAAKDFGDFQKRFPGYMTYDLSQKQYVWTGKTWQDGI